MARNDQKGVKRSNERGNGGGGKTVAAIAIAALLLGGGGYYGLSGDGMGILPNHAGMIDQITTQAPAPDTTAAPETAAPTQNDQSENEILILVKEGTVIYRGSEIPAGSFEDAILKDYREGIQITLQDDHAVKATYDGIKTVLDRLGYPYTEK